MANFKRFGAFALAFAVSLSFVPSVPAQAASKPALAAVSAVEVNGTVSISLKANGYKVKSVKASSSKTSVAKVVASKKKVTVYGLKSGKTKVSATVKAVKNGKTKTFKLSRTIAVNACKGSLERRSLDMGGTSQITLENVPAKATVNYWTSNSSVASVSSTGLVHGNDEGTAVIRAVVSLPKTKFAKAQKVTVNLGSVSVSGSAQNPGTGIVLPGGAQVTNVVQVSSADAVQQAITTSYAEPTEVIIYDTGAPITLSGNAGANTFVTINAPQTSVTNNAAMANPIKIVAVAPNTWHEKANGNYFNLSNTSPVRFVVESGAYTNAIWASGTGAANIEVYGDAFVGCYQGSQVNLTAGDGSNVNALVQDDAKLTVASKDEPSNVQIDVRYVSSGASVTVNSATPAITITGDSKNTADLQSIINNQSGIALPLTINTYDSSDHVVSHTDSAVNVDGTTGASTAKQFATVSIGYTDSTQDTYAATATLAEGDSGSVDFTFYLGTTATATLSDISGLTRVTSSTPGVTVSGGILTVKGADQAGKYVYVVASKTGYADKLQKDASNKVTAPDSTPTPPSEFGTLTLSNTGNVFTASLSPGVDGVTYSFKYATANTITAVNSEDLLTISSGADVNATAGTLTLTNSTLNGKYIYVIATKEGFTPKMTVSSTTATYTSDPAPATPVNLSTATVTVTGTLTYTGSDLKSGIVVGVTVDGAAVSSDEYVVTFKDSTEQETGSIISAGTYTAVVTASSSSEDYTGSKEQTFTVNKATNRLTVTIASNSYTDNQTSVAAVEGSIGFSVSEADGAVTITLNGTESDAGAVNALVAGTSYPLVVTAAGDSNYEAKTITITTLSVSDS